MMRQRMRSNSLAGSLSQLGVISEHGRAGRVSRHRRVCAVRKLRGMTVPLGTGVSPHPWIYIGSPSWGTGYARWTFARVLVRTVASIAEVRFPDVH